MNTLFDRDGKVLGISAVSVLVLSFYLKSPLPSHLVVHVFMGLLVVFTYIALLIFFIRLYKAIDMAQYHNKRLPVKAHISDFYGLPRKKVVNRINDLVSVGYTSTYSNSVQYVLESIKTK